MSKKNIFMACRIYKKKGYNMRTCKNVVRLQNKSNIRNKGNSSNMCSRSNKGKRKAKVDDKSSGSRLRNRITKKPVFLLFFFHV